MGCEECNAAAAGLLARLTSPESIAEQTGILIPQVCPQAADAAACEAGLSQWWGDMANCLFPAFIGAGDACEQLGLCKVKSGLGDWTCDDCTDIMTRAWLSSTVSASVEPRVTPPNVPTLLPASLSPPCRFCPLFRWRPPLSCARISLESASSIFHIRPYINKNDDC